MKALAALLFFVQAAPAFAYGPFEPEALHKITAPTAQAETPEMKAMKVLTVARVGMRDAVGVGEMLMETLDGLDTEIEIVAGQERMVRYARVEDHQREFLAIGFSAEFGERSPRYATLHLAALAAALKYEHIPDSAEKAYMTQSVMARAWLEMGGDRKALPDFDGTRDPRMALAISEWFQYGLSDFQDIFEARRRPTLRSMIQATRQELADAEQTAHGHGSPAVGRLEGRLKRLEANMAEVKAFRKAETDWMMINQHLLGR